MSKDDRKLIEASWERCPVATTQCTRNECAHGCSLTTAPPATRLEALQAQPVGEDLTKVERLIMDHVRLEVRPGRARMDGDSVTDAARAILAALTASPPVVEREAIAREARLRMFLEIIDADGGHETIDDGSWANAFTEEYEKQSPDTINWAVERGFINVTFNDMFETSTAHLTKAGREYLSTPVARGDEVRPLADAPKDGSYFLILGTNFDGGAAVVHWDDGIEWWQLDDGKNPEIALRAESGLTGWMPLPATLTKGARDAGEEK